MGIVAQKQENLMSAVLRDALLEVRGKIEEVSFRVPRGQVILLEDLWPHLRRCVELAQTPEFMLEKEREDED